MPVQNATTGQWQTMWTPRLAERARRLYVDKKMSLAAVAAKLGCSMAAVQNIANRDGWMRKKAGHRQLCAKRAHRIKRLYVRHLWTCQEIADTLKFPVHQIERWVAEQPYKRTLSQTFRLISVPQGRHQCKQWHERAWVSTFKGGPNNYVTYSEYVGRVRKATNLVMYRWGHLVDPRNLRSRNWHLDHQVSISHAFYRWSKKRTDYIPRHSPFPLEVMAHPANLLLMKQAANLRKGARCHLTVKQLQRRIAAFEAQHGKVF